MATIFASLKMILLFPSFRCCISEDNYCSVSFHPSMRIFPSPRLCLTIPILQENTMKYYVENRMHVCSVMSDSLDCKPAGLLRPWDSPGKNTSVSCCSRRSSWPRDQACISCLLHWQAYSLPLCHCTNIKFFKVEVFLFQIFKKGINWMLA